MYIFQEEKFYNFLYHPGKLPDDKIYDYIFTHNDNHYLYNNQQERMVKLDIVLK